MRRGDIHLVDLEPARGSEANKIRPAVIVSNNAANQSVVSNGRGVITVVPLTSNTLRVLTFQVLLPAAESGLTRDSKVQCEQVRAVSPDRVLKRVGSVPRRRMADIDAALRRHLAL
ncbi:type II toxin-antitoxin system PemK/MazF family toxin [Streptomyces sp. NBC_00059]|uniref:type II toxin-antitoxin system PemK/MazF family toxin n=1 Tax=Streptomyces sp. NBC_00059 TaxID=2975635 RepID=UPI0022552A05|nr:type II toxin-antitoxin system PemK/MazF family toxin [Streptomyces sp. NBC_00059]MCX5412576.1 type II toxin-antitoxin system PemK/MazF family toxin [Streptomyces sp. NBC_00059]